MEPGRRRKRVKATTFTDDQKREAVVALVSRKTSAKQIADDVGVTRSVLYKWKKELLGEETPCKMKNEPKGLSNNIKDLQLQVKEL